MKLISLNTWGGSVYEPLIDFIKQQSATTDIFCLQEVFSALPGAPTASSGARMFLFEELSTLLTHYRGFFEIRRHGVDFSGVIDAPVNHGLAVFVKKNLDVLNYNSRVIVEFDPSYAEEVEGHFKVQILALGQQDKIFSIMNFHGIALPGDKRDSPQRLLQSEQLVKVWQSLATPAKILCGDFNLNPDTKSIGILDKVSHNLIKEFNIQNTRNQISWDKYPGSKQHFADYTFVSNAVKVKSFEVPYNEVSDHLPMVLQFEI